jgi:cytochrome c1
MMDDKQLRKVIREAVLILKSAIFMVAILMVVTGILVWPYLKNSTPEVGRPQVAVNKVATTKPEPEIVDGIHMKTGLKAGDGLDLVIQNCTGCHSSKLISQNRMNKTRWKSTIRWMQETQSLWDLGENEEAILEYLATNYAPQKKGRRAPLTQIEWYELN